MTYDRGTLKAELTRDEGRKLSAYSDSLGYLTIGVGHLIDERKGGRLPDAIIDALLDYDIDEKAATLDRRAPWWSNLDDVRQRVMLNMVFNMGWGDGTNGLSGFHNTLAAVQEGRYADAAAGMRASLWYRQVGDRAERLAYAMEHGAVRIDV
jgi:lysozyme